MRRLVWLALLGIAGVSVASTPLARQQANAVNSVPAEAQTSQRAGSKIWVGRHSEFEDFLRTADIERTTTVSTGILGIKRAYFKPGGLAVSAALRSIRPGRYDGFWESYKGDIAAYRLDRLLDLDMVPPTIERRYEGEMVSLQLWASNMKMLKEVQEQKLRPADLGSYNFQLRRQKVFHNLAGNLDPNQGNILFDPLWNVVLVDFSRAFTSSRKLMFPATTIDRPFFERVKALDRDVLRRELGDYVENLNAIDAMLSRRDDVVKEFERLARSRGEQQVILP